MIVSESVISKPIRKSVYVATHVFDKYIICMLIILTLSVDVQYFIIRLESFLALVDYVTT